MQQALGFVGVPVDFAHLVGFAGAWRLSQTIVYKTTVLGGRVDLGDRGIRIVGLLWLLCGLAFAATGVGALVRAGWWQPLAIVVAVFSLALLVELPAAKIGVAVILVALVAGRSSHVFG